MCATSVPDDVLHLAYYGRQTHNYCRSWKVNNPSVGNYESESLCKRTRLGLRFSPLNLKHMFMGKVKKKNLAVLAAPIDVYH